MKPVKKWLIIFCLGLTVASAAGYWVYNASSSVEKESKPLSEVVSAGEMYDIDQPEQPVAQDVSSQSLEMLPAQTPAEAAPEKVDIRRKLAERRSTAVASQEELTAELPEELPVATPAVQTLENANQPLPEVMQTDSEPLPAVELNANTETNHQDGMTPPEPSNIVAEDSVESLKRVWLTLGTGVSFSSLTQDVPGASELNVGKITAPFVLLELGAWLSKVFGLELSYQSLPGKVLSSQSLAVSKEDYTWKTMTAEVNYRMNYLSADSEWFFKVGVQQQEIPFLYAQNASEISLYENNLTNASAGLQYRRSLGGRLLLDSTLRYQYPIAAASVAGAMFNIKSSLILDGDVGAVYSLTKNLSVGGYWSVQYLSYRYQFSESSSSPVQNGDQTLIQSNLNLRLRWEF